MSERAVSIGGIVQVHRGWWIGLHCRRWTARYCPGWDETRIPLDSIPFIFVGKIVKSKERRVSILENRVLSISRCSV